MNKKPAYLYAIELPGRGVAYIGVSSEPKARFRTHSNADTDIGRAIRQYGRENVVLRLLAIGDRDYIYDLEYEAVKVFGTRWPVGFNVSSGGHGGRDQLPRHRERIGVAHLGKTLSLEHRLKLSAAKKTPEAIARLVARNKLGPSEETRRRMVASHLGKRFTEDTRARMSASRMGRQVSEETRRKLKESNVKTWAAKMAAIRGHQQEELAP